MVEEIFNANQIISVRLFDVEEADILWVKFEKEIKFFGIIFQKKGFKHNFLRKTDYIPNEKYYFVKDNVIYEKSHITIVFSDGRVKQQHYNSFEQCEMNYKKLKSAIPINFNFDKNATENQI